MKYIAVILFSSLLLISITAAAEIKKPVTVSNGPHARKKDKESSRPSHCLYNQFQCSNGQCIDKSLTCNRHNDCKDGSDEAVSICFAPGGKTTSTTPRYIEINVDVQPEFTCMNGEFLCTSGECILQNLICNGRRDCRDGSDEESPICNSKGGDNKQCLTTEFRCNSGECIHVGLRCDGSNDCVDSSDEDFSLCRNHPDGRLLVPTAPSYGVIPLVSITTSSSNVRETKFIPCNAPSQPANGRWKLHRSLCDGNIECNAPSNVRTMEPGSYLVYSCDQGFVLNGTSDVLCGPGGKWIHKPKCDEIKCCQLSSSTTEALCTWNNVAVSCEIPAPIGTSAQLKCREGFVQDVVYEQTYENVTCQPDGHWSPKTIQCNKKPKKVKLVLEGIAIFDD